MSKLLKTTLCGLAGLALSTSAHAACSQGMYCQSQTSSLAPLSTWTASSNHTSSGYSSYGASQATTQTYSFSGSPASLPGLGANESLQATSCPTSVYNPEGGIVLGCYNVVKPVPQTSYYRIVRPVIYVRYPVPVAVPYYSGCSVVTHTSRYGDYGYNYHGSRYGRHCH